MNQQKIFSCCLTFLILSVAAVGAAQERSRRDLRTYADGGSYELSYIARQTEEFDKVKEKVRRFVWGQWQRKRAAHILIKDCGMYPEGCHDSVTYNFYIERDTKGSWQLTEESEHYISALENGGKEEIRKGIVTYSKVEMSKTEDKYDCPSLLSESLEGHPKTFQLRLTRSQSNKSQASRPCVIL